MLDSKTITMIIEGVGETMWMTCMSTLFGYIIGLPLGVVLTVTGADGIKQNPLVYKILDVITNLLRSVPFLILMITIRPLTRLIVGKSYGATATIVPLTVAAAPYIARMVESSLKEVDRGVIEAAQSMGASVWEIIRKVLIPEGRTSLVVNATIAMTTILGYSAMSGACAGGGLGDIALRYGYQRWQPKVLMVTVVLLVILAQLIQMIGMFISRVIDRRRV
ncbi:MAG: ABC transporter permease [Lachnospiraceae bacterium]|nr:ABC transporter permease [Lachnospiraceae bacterium]MCD8011795.1 ABC transporter permease [Lachnospiraceae bacterium]